MSDFIHIYIFYTKLLYFSVLFSISSTTKNITSLNREINLENTSTSSRELRIRVERFHHEKAGPCLVGEGKNFTIL